MENERFSNTAESDHFLVKGKPTYMGGQHELWSGNWGAILHTADTIRTGIPQAKHDFATTSPDDQMPFFRGLYPAAVATGRDLASRYDFSAYHTLVDVGGGSGGVALAITEAYPHLHATVMDLPTVVSVTKRFIEEAHAIDRVQALPDDVVNAPLSGTYDVAVLRSLLQVLAPDDALQALTHIGAALNPGGRIFIVGRILDDSRLSPLGTVGFNLVFLNLYGEGRAYTEWEHRDWLTASGFEDIERVPIAGGNSIVTARKPA